MFRESRSCLKYIYSKSALAGAFHNDAAVSQPLKLVDIAWGVMPAAAARSQTHISSTRASVCKSLSLVSFARTLNRSFGSPACLGVIGSCSGQVTCTGQHVCIVLAIFNLASMQ